MPFVIVALTLFASLLVADAKVGAAANNAPDSVRVEQVLTAGQIDSSTVDVGAFVVVIYGQGERHPVSGAWAKLDTARGTIKAIDSRRLIVGLAPDGWSKRIALERIQTLSLIGAPLPADRNHPRTRTTKRVSPAQAEPEVVRSATKREDAGLRVVKKMAAGTAWGGIFTVIIAGAIANDPRAMGGHFLAGAAIGCSIGFPIGVSMVDPYDSLPKTLLAGVIPGAVGIGSVQFRNIQDSNIWFVLGMAYVVPVIGSLIASELWRKPPESRRVSVGLMSEPYGLSAIATLRF